MSLYPVILTNELNIVQQQLNLIKQTDLLVVQIDLIDGLFVDNLTIFPEQLAQLDFGQLKIDLHLMVDEPMETVLFLEEYQNQLPIRAIIAQVEHMSWQTDFCEEVKKHNWQVGLSLNLFTPPEAIEAETWSKLSILQCMAVEAGHQGQAINAVIFDKLKEVRQSWSNFSTANNELLVDGGVKLTNTQQLLLAGATGLVVGSELWQAEDLKETITKFENFLN